MAEEKGASKAFKCFLFSFRNHGHFYYSSHTNGIAIHLSGGSATEESA